MTEAGTASASAARATRRANILASALFAAFAAFVLYLSLTTLRYAEEFAPGPGFIPVWASLVFLVASLWLHVQSWRGVYDQTGDVSFRNLKPGLTYLACLVVSVMLMPVIGLLGLIFLFFVAASILVERTPIWQAVLVGVGMTGALYLLVVVALQVPLPGGMLNFP